MSSILYVAFERQPFSHSWEFLGRHADGIRVAGDSRLGPTHWWSRWLYRRLVPLRVAIFEPGPEERLRGYRIGVARLGKEPMVLTANIHDPAFAVVLWREPVTVFVTDPTGAREGHLTFRKCGSLASAEADGLPVASP